MANPALRDVPAFAVNRPMPPELSMNTAPVASMTYEDTIVKSLIAFAVLAAGAGIGWIFPALTLPALLGGLVLAMVNIFRKMPSAGLTLAYAAVEGMFLGGLSFVYNTQFEGIVAQAVFGTLAVVGVTLFLFLNGKVRTSKRATQVWFVAMIGYLVFQLVSVVLVTLGVIPSMFGLGGLAIFGIPLGLLFAPLIVLLAAYSLVMDFEVVRNGVMNGAPAVYAWRAAFGIMVTVVWLYTEILRFVGIARS